MKDILIRAFKTFIQGFLAVLVVELPNIDLSNEEFVKSIMIGAVAGGISAVMNLIIQALDSKKDVKESE